MGRQNTRSEKDVKGLSGKITGSVVGERGQAP
jgi:hypothetical protein